MDTWALYIDIEGFSNLFLKEKPRAILLLRGLLNDLYKIGSVLYKDESVRLFIYQFGDGFIICPDFEEDTLRPISLATALMRSTLFRDGVSKAAITFGTMEDILGCYPDEIVKKSNNGVVSIGEGILVFSQVIGYALINSYKLSEKVSGPVVVVDEEVIYRIQNDTGIIFEKLKGYREKEFFCINWIWSNCPLIDKICKVIRVPDSKPSELGQRLKEYMNEQDGLTEQWILNAQKLIEYNAIRS